eukprot:CAMPEP_0196576032 /NCGR_PEP_ID=MMETSP1081-20130531/5396_1 /TAXON_ID=36882 /ORGANISM="Pyramimonas amylifera, Strain CCMP720" /LENGTH=263 /DNA_ID=CAMNT_0041894525 /DNA_START=32 /DNA_END=823 /DNA_ORIENTATION=-
MAIGMAYLNKCSKIATLLGLICVAFNTLPIQGASRSLLKQHAAPGKVRTKPTSSAASTAPDPIGLFDPLTNSVVGGSAANQTVSDLLGGKGADKPEAGAEKAAPAAAEKPGGGVDASQLPVPIDIQGVNGTLNMTNATNATLHNGANAIDALGLGQKLGGANQDEDVEKEVKKGSQIVDLTTLGLVTLGIVIGMILIQMFRFMASKFMPPNYVPLGSRDASSAGGAPPGNAAGFSAFKDRLKKFNDLKSGHASNAVDKADMSN